jgi:hypothetical protein
MGIMKTGLWIGTLALAVLAPASPLRADDVKWQAVPDAPHTEASAVTLQAPVALPVPPMTLAAPLMPASGEIQQVRYETAIPVTEPPSQRSTPEIIAVSAPMNALAPPLDEEDEASETLFAVDRPFGMASSGRGSSGGIVQTSASVAVPPGAPAAEVPMVPGWDAPVDASWGAGAPTGPLPEGFEGSSTSPFNPLRPRLYVEGEYLLWWIQGQSVPVLATTSAPSDFAVLGAPTTQVLFGGNQINNGLYSGGRFTAGYWFGCDQNKAVEFTGFFLAPNTRAFSVNSSMFPVIGRPFLDINNGQETAQLTSLPGVSTGTLTINAPSNLWGLGGNYRCLVCCGCNYRISLLAGFRNINLEESLSITENVLGLPTAPPPFTNQLITVNDRFATRNHFYGGNIGADARWYWGRWSVDVRGQVALGDTVQILDISGSQRFVSPTGMVQNFTGGLLALPSNIGHFTNNAFSVVPEVGVNLGYQILPRLRGFVGYNFLYWSNVIRPGTSIDRALDVTKIPNFPLNPEPAPVQGLHPAPLFHEVGFWAQGLTFGLEFVY